MMLNRIARSILGLNENEDTRQLWLRKVLGEITPGSRILDAGAGELRNRPLCRHLEYVSQDFAQYDGRGNERALQTGRWDTSRIDIVSDITAIPEGDESFVSILCSEVLEHIPSPEAALCEFERLLRPGGVLVITAPFVSLVHFAPYHYCSGFSRYWYEYHLEKFGFELQELSPNGDWFGQVKQELLRLPRMLSGWQVFLLPVVVLCAVIGSLLLEVLRKKNDQDPISCFGWHCVAVKRSKQ
jgi:SAM-dependent methyltransferase